jgi:hypothetical protein
MTSETILELIKQKQIPELYIYPNRFNEIDAIWHNKNLAIEVKCKNDFYIDVMIEKQKWQSLMKYSKARYINAMNLDGSWKVFSFNIKKLPEPEWKVILNPNASNELYTGWEPTEMGYFNIRLGKNITDLLLK